MRSLDQLGAVHRKYVVVYDICSSSSMLENLTTNERAHQYENLITDVTKEFEYDLRALSPEQYKFLGDGSIYFFPEGSATDELIDELCTFVFQADAIIGRFIRKRIDIALRRSGLTVGVAVGNIHMTNVYGTSVEYFGRPINLACRLQNSLTDPEQSNKIIVQKEVFQSLKDKQLRLLFSRRERSFRNINAEQATICYEIDPFNLDPDRNET